jgi:hypothetical protein
MSGTYIFSGYQTAQYNVNLYNATQGVNANFTISGQTAYQLNFYTDPSWGGLLKTTPGGSGSNSFIHDVNTSCVYSQNPAGTGFINVTYADKSLTTTSWTVNVYLVNSTGTFTSVATQTNVSGSSCIERFVIPNAAGKNYMVNSTATSGSYGTVNLDSYPVYFQGPTIIIPLLGYNMTLYYYMSFALILILAALFAIADAHLGLIAMTSVAFGTYLCGWMPSINGSQLYTGALIGICFGLAVLETIRYAINKFSG